MSSITFENFDGPISLADLKSELDSNIHGLEIGNYEKLFNQIDAQNKLNFQKWNWPISRSKIFDFFFDSDPTCFLNEEKRCLFTKVEILNVMLHDEYGFGWNGVQLNDNEEYLFNILDNMKRNAQEAAVQKEIALQQQKKLQQERDDKTKAEQTIIELNDDYLFNYRIDDEYEHWYNYRYEEKEEDHDEDDSYDGGYERMKYREDNLDALTDGQLDSWRNFDDD